MVLRRLRYPTLCGGRADAKRLCGGRFGGFAGME